MGDYGHSFCLANHNLLSHELAVFDTLLSREMAERSTKLVPNSEITEKKF